MSKDKWLEEYAELWMLARSNLKNWSMNEGKSAFIAGAEWQKKRTRIIEAVLIFYSQLESKYLPNIDLPAKRGLEEYRKINE